MLPRELGATRETPPRPSRLRDGESGWYRVTSRPCYRARGFFAPVAGQTLWPGRWGTHDTNRGNASENDWWRGGLVWPAPDHIAIAGVGVRRDTRPRDHRL